MEESNKISHEYANFRRRHRLQDSWGLSRRRLALRRRSIWLVLEESIGDLVVIGGLDVSLVIDDMNN